MATLLSRDDPGAVAGDGAARLASLFEAGGATLSVRADASLNDALARFRANARLRLLPVVDEAERPIGALFEEDIRAILYNPYGHSLLGNPAFNQSLAGRMRPCPTADIETPLPELLEAYARANGSEGMMIVRTGRLIGLLSNRTLLALAAERERKLARARTERLDRLEAASADFLSDINALTTALGGLADRIAGAAAASAERSVTYRQRTAAVAAASTQSTDGILSLASQGSALAEAVDRLSSDARAAKEVADHVVGLGETRGRHGAALRDATNAIDQASATIGAVAVQARLLAINAAIEAARLGRHGDGFTVVARELRQFAGQTQQAAATIRDTVGEIRVVAGDVLADHEAVEQVARRIGDVSRSVDAAVAAQAESARLLAGNVAQAVQASGEIGTSIAEIGTLIAKSTENSVDMAAMADGLAGEATRLRGRVAAFVAEVQAAA